MKTKHRLETEEKIEMLSHTPIIINGALMKAVPWNKWLIMFQLEIEEKKLKIQT